MAPPHRSRRPRKPSQYTPFVFVEPSLTRLKLSSIYRTLDVDRQEIRLLVLQPGSGLFDRIECSLQYASLLSDPAYETISYCWGNPKHTWMIWVDGQSFDVPLSAAQALRAVRHSDKTRVLWLDAVCINQADIDERSQQVAIMGRIYAKCTQNLVCLGEQDDASIEALQDIEELWDEIRIETDDFTTLRDTIYVQEGVLWVSRYSNDPIKTTLHASSLVKFLSRPWFSYVSHTTCLKH